MIFRKFSSVSFKTDEGNEYEIVNANSQLKMKNDDILLNHIFLHSKSREKKQISQMRQIGIFRKNLKSIV